MEGTNRELTVEERTWAAQQIALVVGATEADALPLADFLLGVDNLNELQGQLLDMLGESPMALNFSSELIAKRFPPVKQGPAPLLPPRNGNESRPQHSNLSRPQSQLSTRGGPPKPTESPAIGMVAYRKADSSQEAVPSRQQKEPTVSSAVGDEQPVQQKSIRQLKKERQQSLKMQKEQEKKRQERANRKRVRCECQASEHPLLTNCLTCGRIICDSEGPGPCMFCGSEVESPDQQLQQHMRRLLRHSDQAEAEGGNDKQSSRNKPPHGAHKTGMSYSIK
ncbi:Activating signal cointegrator 1, partial [Coemansia sp. RSA 2399]